MPGFRTALVLGLSQLTILPPLLTLSVQIKNGKCEKKDKFHWTVRGPTHGLGAADKGMMVTILGLWPKDGHHHPLITRFHPTSSQHDPHSLRWTLPLELSFRLYNRVTILRSLGRLGLGPKGPNPTGAEPRQTRGDQT